jgi:putative spermidine/putrescine transport system ATP-binding protein
VATPQDLYERPENAFAQFIGESNRLLGTVREVNGHTCVVEIEGGAVRARSRLTWMAPAAARPLSLRPGSCPNLFEARVEELIYHGDHTRTRVRACGCEDFVIKVPNSAGRLHLRAGELIRIGWRIEDCRALDVA